MSSNQDAVEQQQLVDFELATTKQACEKLNEEFRARLLPLVNALATDDPDTFSKKLATYVREEFPGRKGGRIPERSHAKINFALGQFGAPIVGFGGTAVFYYGPIAKSCEIFANLLFSSNPATAQTALTVAYEMGGIILNGVFATLTLHALRKLVYSGASNAETYLRYNGNLDFGNKLKSNIRTLFSVVFGLTATIPNIMLGIVTGGGVAWSTFGAALQIPGQIFSMKGLLASSTDPIKAIELNYRSAMLSEFMKLSTAEKIKIIDTVVKQPGDNARLHLKLADNHRLLEYYFLTLPLVVPEGEQAENRCLENFAGKYPLYVPAAPSASRASVMKVLKAIIFSVVMIPTFNSLLQTFGGTYLEATERHFSVFASVMWAIAALATSCLPTIGLSVLVALGVCALLFASNRSLASELMPVMRALMFMMVVGLALCSGIVGASTGLRNFMAYGDAPAIIAPIPRLAVALSVGGFVGACMTNGIFAVQEGENAIVTNRKYFGSLDGRKIARFAAEIQRRINTIAAMGDEAYRDYLVDMMQVDKGLGYDQADPLAQQMRAMFNLNFDVATEAGRKAQASFCDRLSTQDHPFTPEQLPSRAGLQAHDAARVYSNLGSVIQPDLLFGNSRRGQPRAAAGYQELRAVNGGVAHAANSNNDEEVQADNAPLLTGRNSGNSGRSCVIC